MSNYDLSEAMMALTQTQPIVVRGMPRSGTRMMTDVLNGVPGVSVQNEMPGSVAVEFFNFMSAVDREYRNFAKRNRRRNGRLWQTQKSAVSFAFFIFASKMGPKLKDGEITHIGLKTPGFERFYKSFENVFPNKRPHYLYTVRNPADCWRSIKSMGYYDSADLFKTRYLRSLRNARKIKGHYAERFTVFDLDGFKDAENQGEFLKLNVLSPMGLSDRLSDFSLLAKTENRNALVHSGNKFIEDEDTAREREWLSQDKDILAALEILIGEGRIR